MRPPCIASVLVAAVLVPACAVAVSAQDDFYYYDGKPVRLDRSTTDFVIGVDDDADPAQWLRGAASTTRAESPLLIQGRRFVVLTGMTASLLERIGARDDVWFVSPVYYQPGTRIRMVPTDQIIAKVKASATPDAVSGVLQSLGLQRVALVEGTTDQYLLRIVPAKRADVLRASRELYDTGLFQWVEPDFVQGLTREE